MTTGETVKKIDIFINGHSYTINCPSDEQLALERASSNINNFIQEIRKHAPHLPQEELLVLCALNLYEKSEQLQQLQQKNAEAEELIAGMIHQVESLK